MVENFLDSFEKSSSTKNVSTLASEWPAVNEQVTTVVYISSLFTHVTRDTFAYNMKIKRCCDKNNFLGHECLLVKVSSYQHIKRYTRLF